MIANETAGGPPCVASSSSAPRPLQVFVVCPALNSRLRHWLSDEDGARTRAEQRLTHVVASSEVAAA